MPENVKDQVKEKSEESRGGVPAVVNFTIDLKTASRDEMIDVTSLVRQHVKQFSGRSGLVVVYCPHTTAGVTLQENSDPDVKRDFLSQFARMVPRDAGFVHSEDNSDSHIKASMVGSSVTIPMDGGKLGLGRWQAIYFCEFDGPRTRTLIVRVLAFS